MKINYTLSTLKLFWRASPVMFSIVQFLTICQGFIPFCSLLLFRLIIEKAESDIGHSIIILCSLWVTVFIVQQFVAIATVALRDVLSTKTLKLMNTEIMGKTLSFKGIANFSNMQYREMERRLDFCSNMLPYFLSCMTDVCQYILQVVSVFILFSQLDFWIPCVLLISLIPTILVQKKLSKIDIEFEQEVTLLRIKEMYLRRIVIDPRFVKEFRIFNFFPVFRSRYAKTQDELYSATKSVKGKSVMYGVLGAIPRVFVAGVCLYYLAIKVAAKSSAFYTVGMLAVYLQSVFVFSDAFLQVANWKTEVSRCIETLRFFFDYKNYSDSIIISKAPQTLHGGHIEEITFKNVSFSYDKENTVLQDLNFSIKAGEVCAIVGENGAGKTTLTQLLHRFYDVDSGSILVNGIDIRELNIDEYRSKISAVFQDYSRFELTLKENIFQGEVVPNEIPENIKEILGENFCDTLTEGLDTTLGLEFGGREVSGGEWQRIAIARGIQKNADVFIVDEPTASIDPIQETAMYEKIITHAKHITILVTHRLGSIRKATKILVLKEGKLVAVGTHENLMKDSAYYNALYSSQADMYVENR